MSKKEISNIGELKKHFQEKEEKLLAERDEIEIKPFETFKLHDLANMFPFNITPALIESKIAHAIAAKQRMFNSLTPQMAFLVIALLVGAAIAGIILWKFMGADQQEVRVIVEGGGGMVKAITNMTG